jgi:hypothetical protein
MKHSRLVLGLSLSAALASLLIAEPASAALITSTADLPPDGVYLSTDIHSIYGGPALEILLERPEHKPIAQEVQRRDGGDADGDGIHDEEEQFPSTLQGNATVSQGGIPVGTFPIAANGPVVTRVYDKFGQTTGTFDTEMLSMSLTGSIPPALGGGTFMIRESPTLQSTGQTTITDIGGGLFRIDSFFDVFTELSIDGGATWMPDNNGPAHVELVPEPGTMTLLGLGAVVLAGLGWRRRRAA